MRAVIYALGLLLGLSSPAWAQHLDANPKLTLARQIVSELITDDRINQISDSFLPAIVKPIEAQGLKISPVAQLGIQQVMRDEMHQVIAESRDDLANAYVATFSQDELSTLVGFYASGLGKKLLIEEPKLMGNFMPQVEARVVADMPSLRTKIAAVFASLPQSGQ